VSAWSEFPGASALRRSTWSLLTSLAFHSLIIFVLGWQFASRPQYSFPLAVSLVVPPALRAVKQSAEGASSGQAKDTEPPRRHAATEEAVRQLPTGDAPLPADRDRKNGLPDLDQIRNQARGYGRMERAEEEAKSVVMNDYYGKYSGDDQGTFHFHLDRTGRLSGTAESSWRSQSFAINGEVAIDAAASGGSVQMAAKGLAGAARFNGAIDAKTGSLTGHWSVAGFGGGQFSGQRE
jgi:hypothetical protein